MMTPAESTYSFCDSATVTARRMLGRASATSYPRNWRARVMHTPCASVSSTMSFSGRPPPHVIKRQGIVRRKGRVVRRLRGPRCRRRRRTRLHVDDKRGGVPQIASTFSCNVVRIDGVFRSMLTPSDTAKRARSAVEKMNGVPMIRWYYHDVALARRCRPKWRACLFAWPLRHVVHSNQQMTK